MTALLIYQHGGFGPGHRGDKQGQGEPRYDRGALRESPEPHLPSLLVAPPAPGLAPALGAVVGRS